ncbi:DUF421 domain-containing protein [Arcanobacterium hippocoleae]
MSYPDSIAQWLSLPLYGIFATVLGTVAIYLLFLFAVRIFGQRLLTSLTTFDTLMVLLFGSIVARTALGPVPTLTTGIVTFATLIGLHFSLGRFANTAAGDRFLNRDPMILIAGNQLIEKNMKATNTTSTELMSALRERGIHSLDQIAVVIIEPTGKLAVLQNNTQIDPQILHGVKDQKLIPAEYIKK